ETDISGLALFPTEAAIDDAGIQKPKAIIVVALRAIASLHFIVANTSHVSILTITNAGLQGRDHIGDARSLEESFTMQVPSGRHTREETPAIGCGQAGDTVRTIDRRKQKALIVSVVDTTKVRHDREL